MDRDRFPELLTLARGIADAFESLVLPALLFQQSYVDPSPDAQGIAG